MADDVTIRPPRTVSLQVLGYAVAGVFLLGQIWTRFTIIEAQIATLVAEEELVATKAELATVEARLTKWITRAEALAAEVQEIHLTLVRLEADSAER